VAAVTATFVPLVLGGCISEEREQEIGDDLAAQVNPRLPLMDDPMLTAYVHAVGQHLGQVSARPDLEYQFYIIDTDIANAFALPGGHIYLTRGLIGRISNGEEFAGVLAHEIGHVAARHGVMKLQRELRTGSLVSVLYNTFLGGEPGLLKENALDVAGVLWSAHHSRREETEADRLAVEYLSRSGVQPDGVITLLETFLADEAEQRAHQRAVPEWLSTHPLTEARIRAARAEIARLDPDEAAAPEQSMNAELGTYPLFKLLVNRHPRLPTSHAGP
jgi:predicted Zn-dependent protease